MAFVTIKGQEVILPAGYTDPVVVDMMAYELPVAKRPHDAILNNVDFMRSKKVDFYQAELIYKNFNTGEYFTKLTEIHDNSYDVEIELIRNDFSEKETCTLTFFTFRKAIPEYFDKAMDVVLESLKRDI